MALREKIASLSGIDSKKIPGSYQIIGDIMLLKFPRKIQVSMGKKKKIALACMKILANINTVCESLGIEEEYRKPRIKHLAGKKNFKTLHKENGIFYSIDVSKLMFSKGNLFERQRVIEQVNTGETVVDMFAGIGYFSLGLAKFSNAEKIISIEKNPVSFGYLKKNMKLNKAEKITPIKGDCRSFSKKSDMVGIADRILMGYLPKTYLFLPQAFSFLKSGGIIHYHDTFLTSELWKKPEQIIEKYAKDSGFSVKILSEKKVKSYAPNVWHVVIDFEATRSMKFATLF